MSDWRSKHFIENIRKLLDYDIGSYPIHEWITLTEKGLVIAMKYRRVMLERLKEIHKETNVIYELDMTFEGMQIHNRKMKKLRNEGDLLLDRLSQLDLLIKEYTSKLSKIKERERIEVEEAYAKYIESQSAETELEINSANETSNKKGEDVERWIRNNFFIISLGILILIYLFF